LVGGGIVEILSLEDLEGMGADSLALEKGGELEAVRSRRRVPAAADGVPMGSSEKVCCRKQEQDAGVGQSVCPLIPSAAP